MLYCIQWITHLQIQSAVRILSCTRAFRKLQRPMFPLQVINGGEMWVEGHSTDTKKQPSSQWKYLSPPFQKKARQVMSSEKHTLDMISGTHRTVIQEFVPQCQLLSNGIVGIGFTNQYNVSAQTALSVQEYLDNNAFNDLPFLHTCQI